MNRDLLFMLSATTLSCIGVGLLGWVGLRMARRRSVTVSLVLAALVPVLAIVVAVQVNVQAMFISAHDAEVITVVVSTAAVLGVVVGYLLGRRIAASSQALGKGLQDLANTYDQPASERMPAVEDVAPSAELAALASQLAEVRASLTASRERERELEASRRELVAGMSHDLRSPLAGIRALAEGLEDGVIADEPGALTQLRANVDRMTRMVDDLLELSRLQERADRPHALVSLEEIVEDVVAEVRPYAASRDVSVKVDVGSRLAVRGDGDDLTRAVSNLVGNAVQHTSASSTVLVSGVGNRGAVFLEVADQCGGIPADQLPRVFDIGWRGDPERTPGGDSGAGLGLAIVRGVVDAHGGTVAVANHDDGCRFTISLPAAS